VVLFNGANSKWNSDGVIFVKSNLNLLPAIHSTEVTTSLATAVDARGNDEAGEEGGVKLPADIEAASNGEEDHKAPNAPIGHAEAFDEAIPNPSKEGTLVSHAAIVIFSQPIRRASRSFKFIGWYKITRLQTIEPESEELVHTLIKIWETKERHGRVVSRQRDVSK
jgi:hypothetical protein